MYINEKFDAPWQACAQLAAAVPKLTRRQLDEKNDLGSDKCRFSQRFKHLRATPLHSCTDITRLHWNSEQDSAECMKQSKVSLDEAHEALNSALEDEDAFTDAQRAELSSLARLANANRSALNQIEDEPSDSIHFDEPEHSAYIQLRI